MDLSQLLTDLFDEKTLKELAKDKQVEPEKVTKVAQMGVPVLLEKLGINAQNEEKRTSLEKALKDHEDDDVSDVLGFLEQVDQEDSSKMLNHILGSKKDTVAQGIAKQSGLDMGEVVSMLSMLAPLVMGYLGNQKKQQSTQKDSGGLGDLLGKVTKQVKASDKTDSSIGDMLTGMLGGLFK